MSIFFNATPNRENVPDENTPLFSKRAEPLSQFSPLEQQKKQELIRSIQEVENYFKSVFNSMPIASLNLPPLEQLDSSKLQAVFQDIRAEITFKKARQDPSIQDLGKKETHPSALVQPRELASKPENIIWIDKEIAERKSRSRTRKEGVETGTNTARELDEIKQMLLESISEEHKQIVSQIKKMNQKDAEFDRQKELKQRQQKQALEERLGKRIADPRYDLDPQFCKKTILLATPFLEDHQAEVEVKAELQKFIEESGYARSEPKWVALRRESKSSKAYGSVRILNSAREEFYTLHTQPDGKETWLEEMQERIAEVARTAAEKVTEEVQPIAINVYSRSYGELNPILKEKPQPESSSRPKKKVQFVETVKARVIFPGELKGDSYIDLETMNLEHSKW